MTVSTTSTILIVDDEMAGRETLAALLATQDYQFIFAATGAEALEQAAAHSPDVILLDVMMPGMDGFEVCRRIRATPELADSVVILLTALDDRKSRLQGIEAGADDFIVKPFDRIELRTRLRTITRLNRARRLTVERAKFEGVVNLSPNGILIVDADGYIRMANPALGRMLGADASTDLRGTELRALIAPEHFDRFWEQIRALLANEAEAARFETVLALQNGERLPAEGDAGRFVWDSAPAVQVVLRDITSRKLAETRAQNQLERMVALHTIDAAITSSIDLQITLNTILDLAVEHLQVDAAAVLLRQPDSQIFEYAQTRGIKSAALPRTQFLVGEGCAGYAALHRRMLRLPDPDLAWLTAPLAPTFPVYYGTPLIIKGQVEGVLELFCRAAPQGDPEWLSFLEAIAGQTAVAIEHAALFQSLQHSNAELLRAYDTTLEGWARALELRDKETEGHAQRVTEMTVRLARRMGIPESELAHIRRGALLHDIGKMGVPDSILLKPGPLNDDEWAVMRQHPTMAYELLAPVAFLRQAIDIPYYHHERWDGTGYPRGLKGEEIPLAARIFAVVDVWDALRADRPYRAAWPEERVRNHIRALAGTHFDPQVVAAFLSMDEQADAPARKSVLVVDDDPDIADAQRRALRDHYNVFVALSGDEALSILAQEEIAVILTDQRMPGLTGVQLLERTRHIRPEALGIICSAYFDSDALSEALNLGTVRGFVHKPWTVMELRRRVHEVAQQYRRPNDT